MKMSSRSLRGLLILGVSSLPVLLPIRPVLGAGENPILQAQKAKAALEKVQWSKHEFIESLENYNPQPGDFGPLTEAEKRANAIHFLKANQKVERQIHKDLRELYDKLINAYSSTDHQADPTIRSLKRINRIYKEIDAKLTELADPQERAERLMRKLRPEREPPDSSAARDLLRDAAREISRRAALEVARNAARHMGREGARPHPEGHHHGPGGY